MSVWSVTSYFVTVLCVILLQSAQQVCLVSGAAIGVSVKTTHCATT